MSNVSTLSKEEKRRIATSIKPLTLAQIEGEYRELQAIGTQASQKSERCRVGNNVVDYFTFAQRLETRGKYDMSFYDFLANWESFQEKKFIQTMVRYYKNEKNKNGTKNEWVVKKEIYNICISSINIIRPLVYMEIYARFHAHTVLDFCAGWGGAMVGASVIPHVKRYIGIELNQDLREPYQQLEAFLGPRTQCVLDMRFENALDTDYASLPPYDLVFTSPPYYFIQKYPHNVGYANKDEMDTQLYRPLFLQTFQHLQPGGHYVLNVSREVYERVCIPLLGPAQEETVYRKSKRQNQYQERVFIWRKP